MTQRAILPALLVAATLPLGAATARSPARADPLAARPAAAVQDMAPEEIVRRANEAMNGSPSMAADFLQINPDGRRQSGRLYVSRPGRLRFDYDAPSPMEIVADGSHVVVRDRRLKTSDTYPISQTPLDFLLRDPIDLSAMNLRGAVMGPNGASIHVESRSALVGDSKVTLLFDPQVRNLLQWRVLDAQGRATVVTLSAVDRDPARTSDERMFDVRYQIPQSR